MRLLAFGAISGQIYPLDDQRRWPANASLKFCAPGRERRFARGFSLIEMMITLAIAAIMLGIAVPAMSGLIASNRLKSQASDLLANLALARSEAIKRGVLTTLCPSDTGTGCTNTDWSAGYLLFINVDGDNNFDTGSDSILRVGGRLSGNSTLASSDFRAAAPLHFLPSGQAGKAGSFTLCQSGQAGRIIAVTLAGGVSAASSSCP